MALTPATYAVLVRISIYLYHSICVWILFDFNQKENYSLFSICPPVPGWFCIVAGHASVRFIGRTGVEVHGNQHRRGLRYTGAGIIGG